ncbi:hypothetical protein [Paenibacillus sp. CCS19]|uniref:hypothetical protein n=1 Tax=Paenibacillus sp. CCS19 TaxID=3158387 RepID=UPI00295F49A8|nr:hypothetical protein [Paenibacillus cellulosilyticus]
MKVQLYLIRAGGSWSVRWSLAMDVDLAFWREGGAVRDRQGGSESNEEGSARGFGGYREQGWKQRRNSEVGEEEQNETIMHVWRTPLPLGIAEEATARWMVENEGRAVEERSAVRAFRRAVQAAVGFEIKGKGEENWTERVVVGVGGEREGRRQWQGPGRDEGEGKGQGQGQGQGQNQKLREMFDEDLVQAIVERLHGRAALLGEAQELLAAGPPACRAVVAGGWSALAPALQLFIRASPLPAMRQRRSADEPHRMRSVRFIRLRVLRGMPHHGTQPRVRAADPWWRHGRPRRRARRRRAWGGACRCRGACAQRARAGGGGCAVGAQPRAAGCSRGRANLRAAEAGSCLPALARICSCFQALT